MIKFLKQWKNFFYGIHLFRKGFSGFNSRSALEKELLNSWQVNYYKKHYPDDVLGGNN